jgi:hypothetical protein
MGITVSAGFNNAASGKLDSFEQWAKAELIQCNLVDETGINKVTLCFELLIDPLLSPHEAGL